MAEIVNLRRARKQRERADARARTAVRTGGAAGEAERVRADAELARRRHEGHRRDEDDGTPPADGGA